MMADSISDSSTLMDLPSLPPTSPAPAFDVLIAVGPGDRERQRLLDVLQSLAATERAAIRQVILVDDGAALSEKEFEEDAPLPICILPSIREKKGDHWRGGLVTNILHGMRHSASNAACDFLLKLDTDTLVIRPVGRQIASQFLSNPGIGILGAFFRKNLGGVDVPVSSWKINLAKWRALIRLRRNPFPRLETSLWGRNKRIRTLLLRAIAQGWPLGHCAQGGGYAVSRTLLESWKTTGVFDDPLLWRHTDLGEDIVSALLCYAAGNEIQDFNQTGEAFGVQHLGLAFDPPGYFERGYGVVHSVKCPDPEEEYALRAAFLSRLGLKTHFAAPGA